MLEKNKKLVNFSIAVIILVSTVLLILLLFGTKIFEFYMVAYRGFAPAGEALKMLKWVFGLCFYSSAAFAAAILYSLYRLLTNIKKNEFFIDKNVKCLRVVAWCCFIIALITFAGGMFYMPFLFISAAGIFVGVLLSVLKNVMQSAVLLREDNDLTI